MADKTLHIAILAGESSGDRLGGALMSALQIKYPHVRFSGIGGTSMTAQGLHSLVEIQRLSVMGLVEVIKHLPDLLRVKNSILSYWSSDVPDIFIGIDAPDFNLRIAKVLHAQGVPTVHYVSPSLWAWKEKRIEVIKRAVDLVLCLFPFETAVYDKHGVNAVCVGHPMRDTLRHDTAYEARQLAGFVEQGKLLGIFPGSRAGEIRRLLPLYLEACNLLQKRWPDLAAFVSVSDSHHLALVESIVIDGNVSNIVISEQSSNDLLNACDVALLTSGTITLEAALLQTPMVVAYKVNMLTAAIAKLLLKIDRFALPNLLDQRDLVPELIQENATANNIAEQVALLLTNTAAVTQQLQGFARINAKLPDNVSARAAESIGTLLANHY